MTRPLFALVLLTVAAWLATRPGDAAGCAAAPREGERIDTADEAAFIVWDAQTKTEHFVRRATFRGTGYDFGFLVPTPNPPELEVAREELFHDLAALTAPRVEYRTVVREVDREFDLGCGMRRATMEAAGMADKSAMPGGVEVLDRKRVGDYDATVLKFRRGDGDDARSGARDLAAWLAKHGYESPPAVGKWLEEYVRNEWCVTAFKIASDAKKDGPKPQSVELRARPIRMSFKAEKPFYPYREPETEPTAGPPPARLLRVFVAAQGRFAGKLGDGAKPWPGQTVWARPVDAGRRAGLFAHAELKTPPAADGWWVTEFEDHSSPRPGTAEVYFEPAADRSPVERPPHVVTNTRVVTRTPLWHGVAYIGIPVAILVAGLVTWRLARRA